MCVFIQVRKQLGSPFSYSRREGFSITDITVTNKAIIASFFSSSKLGLEKDLKILYSKFLI